MADWTRSPQTLCTAMAASGQLAPLNAALLVAATDLSLTLPSYTLLQAVAERERVIGVLPALQIFLLGVTHEPLMHSPVDIVIMVAGETVYHADTFERAQVLGYAYAMTVGRHWEDQQRIGSYPYVWRLSAEAIAVEQDEDSTRYRAITTASAAMRTHRRL